MGGGGLALAPRGEMSWTGEVFPIVGERVREGKREAPTPQPHTPCPYLRRFALPFLPKPLCESPWRSLRRIREDTYDRAPFTPYRSADISICCPARTALATRQFCVCRSGLGLQFSSRRSESERLHRGGAVCLQPRDH